MFKEVTEPTVAPAIPRITFAIICYNQERHIKDAVLSALSQDYSPLEIVISDDASTDNTFDIVRELLRSYTGPHCVILHRNNENQGIAANVNKIWELSSGDFVVFQAGDDISQPHRTSALVSEWMNGGMRSDLVYSTVEFIDEDGRRLGRRSELIAETPSVAEVVSGRRMFVAGGCASAYARRLHSTTGPLASDIKAEDVAYSFRALLGGGVVGVDEPLVAYRIHDASIMAGYRRASQAHGGVISTQMLIANLATLQDTARAMRAMEISDPSLWRKWKRRMRSVEMLLKFRQGSTLTKWQVTVLAALRLRPRLLLTMLREMITG